MEGDHKFGRVICAMFIAVNSLAMLTNILVEMNDPAWWHFLRGAGFAGLLIWTVLLLYGLYTGDI